MSDLQTVEAAGLLDSLVKLFFKGLDGLLDAATEYQKEMGVLKQVSKYPVKDNKGNEYTVVVKLSPIKDKDGVFYVEISCDGYDKFSASKVDKKALKINRDNGKEFEKLIKEIIKKNGLEIVESDEYADLEDEEAEDTAEEESEDLEEQDLGDIEFSLITSSPVYPDKKPFDLRMHISVDDKGKYSVEISTDPSLSALEGASTFSTLGQFADYIERKISYTVEEAEGSEDSLSDFIVLLKELSDSPEEEAIDELKSVLASSFTVTLSRTILASGHDSIDLVDISADSDRAFDILQEIVGSDEFVDAMPEGESSYRIVDYNDHYSIY